MGKGGLSFNNFKQLQKQIESISAEDLQEFNVSAVKALASRLLAKAKKRTPVNKKIPGDINYTGGGNLRRSWTIGEVTKEGNVYCIDVVNTAVYASYVEKGHRGVYIPKLGVTMHTDTHFTEGVFMLKISEAELKENAEKILGMKLTKFLKNKVKL